MTTHEPKKNFIDRAFRVSLFIKAIDGTLQLIGGTLLLIIPHATLVSWLDKLSTQVMPDNNETLIAQLLHTASQHYSVRAEIFLSLYMLSHGVIKLGLVYGLLREKLWVFPLAFVAFAGLILIELDRILIHHYWGVIILLSFDTFVLTMVILEYRRLKAGLVHPPSSETPLTLPH
jgi:uncharacterized membrane protein